MQDQKDLPKGEH